MTAVELVRSAQSRNLTSEDGEPIPLELEPPLDEAGIAELEATLPAPLPKDVRELLGFCSGFAGPIELVDFTGRECMFEMPEVFPHGLPIGHDGFGNFWVVDLLPGSVQWGPIYFACHDAPVVLYQSPDLRHFLEELFKLAEPPHASLVDDVHEDRLFEVWSSNPGVRRHDEAMSSDDEALRDFAAELGPTYEIIDLRGAEIGMGFSGGRYGPQTVIRRHATEPIFAVERREGFLKRLFGRR